MSEVFEKCPLCGNRFGKIEKLTADLAKMREQRAKISNSKIFRSDDFEDGCSVDIRD